MHIERLISTDPRSFIDENGDVRFNADLLPEMDEPASTAVRALSEPTLPEQRKRPGTEPVNGRSVADEIDTRQLDAENALGRPLTESEMRAIASNTEREARGI